MATAFTKTSISLDADLLEATTDRAGQIRGASVSLLASIGLRHVLALPVADVRRLVNRERLNRRAQTRSAWMDAYWSVLNDLMGRPQMDVIENPFAPRHYGDFYAVMLLNHIGRADSEQDPFIAYVGPSIATPRSPAPYQWTFDRSSSPVQAATLVASKLAEFGVVPPVAEGGD